MEYTLRVPREATLSTVEQGQCFEYENVAYLAGTATAGPGRSCMSILHGVYEDFSDDKIVRPLSSRGLVLDYMY